MKTDLSLEALSVFLALYEQQNLSKAAQVCEVSKATATRHLTRLRENFHDELFLRRSIGMAPTAKAHQIYPEIAKVFDLLDELSVQERFDEKKLNKVFRITGVDNAIASFLSPAIPSILEKAPHVGIQFVSMVRSIGVALRTGEIDFAVLPIRAHAPDLRYSPLAIDGYVAVVAKDHPLLQEKLAHRITMADLYRYRQLRITIGHHERSNTSLVDDRAMVPKRAGRVALWTPYFQTIPKLLAHTTLWVAMPYHIALQQRRDLGVTVVLGRIPDAPLLTTKLYWHERNHRNVAYQWLRARILGANKHLQDIHQVPILALGAA